MKREIQKIAVTITATIIAFWLLDFGIGKFFDTIISHMPPDGERVAKSYFALHRVNADMLIIGSSRAETAYDSRILMDSLPELSVYNCGGDAQEFYYCNTLINCILDRYTPKVIVWDFKERQLGIPPKENLSLIYPYYWTNSYIRQVLDRHEGSSFKYIMHLNTYRYNATAGRILRSVFASQTAAQSSTLGFDGRPVNRRITLTPKDFKITDGELDPDIVREFKATVRRIKHAGCKLFIVISPMYDEYNQDNFYTRETSQLCQELGITFIDDSHLEGFTHNKEYAFDNYHININGAEVFTRHFASQLKEYLGK